MIISQVPAAAGNFQQGRSGKKVKFIVMHWMAGKIAGADARFTKPGEQASAHYGIGGKGEIHQYVRESDTAFHAGNFDINQQSIGIEHEGGPNIPITDAVYITSAEIIKEICARFHLPINRETLQCPGTLDIDRIIQIATKQPGVPMNWEQLAADRLKQLNEKDEALKNKDAEIDNLKAALLAAQSTASPEAVALVEALRKALKLN